MIIPLIKKFLRSRRGATAVVLAIMTVPLLISASAAVDFARIASARTLLQASVDSAANAAVGAYQTSQTYTTAQNVGQAAYAATGVQLPSFVTVANLPTIAAYCYALTGSAIPCDAGSTSSGPSSGYCPTSWTTADDYCVVATQSVTLKNSLFAWLIPSEVLSVRAVAITQFPPNILNSGSFPPGPGFTSAGDGNVSLLYPVPQNADGSSNYAAIQSAAGCNGVPGAELLPGSSAATSTTTCQYLFIGGSNNTSTASGSLTLAPGQAVAFLFTNSTGANNYTQSNSTNYPTHILVSTNSNGSNSTYYPDGYAPGYSTIVSCNNNNNNNNNCTKSNEQTTTTTTTPPTTDTAGSTTSCTSGNCRTTITTNTFVTLQGQCPSTTLYGSMSPGFGSPASDSLDVYSSAYEVLGYPPTQYANRPITPFLANYSVANTVNNKTYYVTSVCPNYPTSGTLIRATVNPTYAANNPDFAGSSQNPMNIFSTWFPTVSVNNVAYSDTPTAPAQDSAGNNLTTGFNDVFPPGISGCTPATHATDGGTTPASKDPWWNWSNSNYGNCSNTVQQPQSTSTASYKNCALLIEPLGTNVPTSLVGLVHEALLPDYYNIISTLASPTHASIVALDPVYDGQTYIDPLSNVSVSNNYLPGTVPGNLGNASLGYTQIGTAGLNGSGKYVNDYIVTEVPATSGIGQDHNLPSETSSQCYNSQANGNAQGQVTLGEVNQTASDSGDNNNGTAIDPVGNPQDGAIICNSPTPHTYGIYWNDMGTYGSDDLGYWNEVQAFTCSVPPKTNAGGGPSTLSG